LKIKDRRRTSALSLKKAQIVEEENDATQSQRELPYEDFSEADFIVYWKKYIEVLNKQKEKMLASILASAEPVLNKTTIKVVYANAMMMEEVRKNQTPILNYLREKLKNYALTFDLQYNEDTEKSFVYTPQEKYDKLLEINPQLSKFRKNFDLDI
jgi:DNA polymerase-3 subunit gamma/tau